MDLLTLILLRLNKTSRIEVTRDDIQNPPDEQVQLLLDSKLLVASGRADYVKCCLCDQGHISRVVYLDEPSFSGYNAYYDCPTDGRDWIDDGRLQKWTATVENLCQYLADTMATGQQAQVVLDGAWFLGSRDFLGLQYPLYVLYPHICDSLLTYPPANNIVKGSIVFVLGRIRSAYTSLNAAALTPLSGLLSLSEKGVVFDDTRMLEIVNQSVQVLPSSTTHPKSNHHSPDFRSVTVKGVLYVLSPFQARVIEALWKAADDGTPELSQGYLLEEVLETTQKRLSGIFKDLPNWRNLVAAGQKKDTFRLNLD